MEQSKVQVWTAAVETAEATPMTENLPTTANVGMDFEDTDSSGTLRKWKRVTIRAGSSGARWAYWKPWIDEATKRPGIGPNPQHQVIVDRIFNGDAAHFAGMLGVPYPGNFPGVNPEAWLLVSPRMTGTREVRIPEEKPKERYERSRETYDVETGKTQKL